VDLVTDREDGHCVTAKPEIVIFDEHRGQISMFEETKTEMVFNTQGLKDDWSINEYKAPCLISIGVLSPIAWIIAEGGIGIPNADTLIAFAGI